MPEKERRLPKHYDLHEILVGEIQGCVHCGRYIPAYVVAIDTAKGYIGPCCQAPDQKKRAAEYIEAVNA